MAVCSAPDYIAEYYRAGHVIGAQKCPLQRRQKGISL